MVAGAGPGGRPHPVLGQGAGQAHLAGGRGDLGVLVVELLLDEGLGVGRVPLPLLTELVQEVLVGETLHGVDRDGVGHVGYWGPANGESVLLTGGGGGGVSQLDEVGDVQGAGRSPGLCSWLAGQRVGEGTHLPIDSHSETLREVVRLLAGRLQERESQLDLVTVLQSSCHHGPGPADLPGLAGAQLEHEGLLLELHLASRRLQTGGTQEDITADVERQSSQDNIGEQWVDRVLLDRNNRGPADSSAH